MSDRIDKPKFIKDTLPFLVVVALVAAAIIVSYSVASISLLGTSEETLKGSRIDNSPLEDKVVGTAVSYSDVPVQTKSPSSSDADNMPSSTPVPLPSDMPGEETVAQPALKLTPDRVVSSTAIETSHTSTQGPSTVETAPSELNAPQEVSAPPASTADAANATAIETSHTSMQGPTTVETAPSELNAPQEVSAPRARDLRTIR